MIPRRDKGERCEQADVAFGFALARGDVCEGGDTALDEIIDPRPCFGDRPQRGITALGLEGFPLSAIAVVLRRCGKGIPATAGIAGASQRAAAKHKTKGGSRMPVKL
jgi:hypothetical protein